MKSLLVKTFSLFAVILNSFTFCYAMSSDQIFSCDIDSQRGEATVVVSAVEEHPELKVFKINLKIRPFRKVSDARGNGEFATMAGLFAVTLSSNNNSFVGRSLLYTVDGSEISLKELLTTIQGELNDDGYLVFDIYDNKRMLHGGYGARVGCTKL